MSRRAGKRRARKDRFNLKDNIHLETVQLTERNRTAQIQRNIEKRASFYWIISAYFVWNAYFERSS